MARTATTFLTDASTPSRCGPDGCALHHRKFVHPDPTYRRPMASSRRWPATGSDGFSGDGGLATKATLSEPQRHRGRQPTARIYIADPAIGAFAACAPTAQSTRWRAAVTRLAAPIPRLAATAARQGSRCSTTRSDSGSARTAACMLPTCSRIASVASRPTESSRRSPAAASRASAATAGLRPARAFDFRSTSMWDPTAASTSPIRATAAVRHVTPDGVISTVAGNGVRPAPPRSRDARRRRSRSQDIRTVLRVGPDGSRLPRVTMDRHLVRGSRRRFPACRRRHGDPLDRRWHRLPLRFARTPSAHAERADRRDAAWNSATTRRSS